MSGSYSWNFFKDTNDNRMAKCIICGDKRVFKDKNGKKTTGGMNRHLLISHKITKTNFTEFCNFNFYCILFSRKKQNNRFICNKNSGKKSNIS